MGLTPLAYALELERQCDMAGSIARLPQLHSSVEMTVSLHMHSVEFTFGSWIMK